MKSWLLLLGALVAACNVPEPDRDRRGIEPPPLDRDHPNCGRGIAVLNTDYQSTSVSLLDRSGEVLSPSFISSASASTGLSVPLGGDVVLPTETASEGELVLIDRSPVGVLTWVDFRTARARQLSVSSDSPANPHDYATIGPAEAWVTRFAPNASDLLLVDPRGPAIAGELALAPAMAGTPSEYFASPDHAVLVGRDLYVLLEGYRADYTVSVESRVARIDTSTRELVSVQVLAGMHGCGGFALSPDRSELAVFCSGEFRGTSNPALDSSGVVVLSVPDLGETHRFSAVALGGEPVSFSGSFVDDERLLLVTQGRFADRQQAAQADRLLELELATGAFRTLLESAADPFTLGDVSCPGDCGLCFAADAGRRVVHRLRVEAGSLVHDGQITTDDRIGLPPRRIGVY